jgi:hypothetical protein
VGNYKSRITSNILDISQASYSKGDFYEMDTTVYLTRQHKAILNGSTRVRPNIVYEKKQSLIQVQFGEHGCVSFEFCKRTRDPKNVEKLHE